MDCAPLNLAHFHERRADRFLKQHRYDDASKAIETSLLYVQDAYKNAKIAKSIEVLDTQKWDYERKLRQIQMRKMQHERLKLKEIVPTTMENNSVMLKQDASISTLSITKSIHKTIEDFDAKFSKLSLSQPISPRQDAGSKENYVPRSSADHNAEKTKREEREITNALKPLGKYSLESPTSLDDNEDFPSLDPLGELPTFDFNVFTTSSTTTLGNITGFAECFQK